MSREIVVADASCLIALQNIQELLLVQKLFGETYITQEVAAEFGGGLPDWIKMKEVQNKIQQNALSFIPFEAKPPRLLCLWKPPILF